MNSVDALAMIALVALGIYGATKLDAWEAEMDDSFLSDIRSDSEILRAVEDERLAVFQDPDEPYDWEEDEDNEV